MRVKADGRLAHHWHGTYWATIVLCFDQEWEAKSALETGLLGSSSWAVSDRNPKVLSCNVENDELDVIVDALAELGAERDKIASVAKSIDLGEPFSIELDVVDPRQILLGF